MRTISLAFRTIFCGLILLALAATASAQFKASVQGTVTDAGGAIIAGATVTLTSNETTRTQQVKSSDEGFYRFSGLPPGKYTITAEQAGFKKQVLENVEVNAEQVQGIDLQLQPGVVTETVTVTDQLTPQLETENANLDRAITTQEVRRLPQFGRDPYELARLTPGVFGDSARGGAGGAVNLPNTTGPGESERSIFQTENRPQISANGQRVSANNYQLDGVSVNSLTHGGAAVVTPNQESVKEIRVIANTYSAEYGRNSGAQVLVVSQNGTNDFHGSAFLKYDSPKLNSFNKYGGPGAQPVRVNQLLRQFGGSLGGPLPVPRFGEDRGPGFKLLRDKAFFFLSYEGLRSSNTDFANAFIETPEYRNLVRTLRPNSVTARVFNASGIEPRIVSQIPVTCAFLFSNPADQASRCRNVGGRLDLGSLTGAQGQYISYGNPVGGGFDNIPDLEYAQIAIPQQIRGNQYNARIDYNRGTKDLFAVSTYITHQSALTADSAGRSRPMGDILSTPVNTALTFTWNRTISSSKLNEARINFTRFSFNEVQSSSGTNFGIPRIEVEGLPIDRIRFGAPQSETTPGIFAENTIEFRDTLRDVVGNHGLSFGVEIRKEQDNNNLNGASRPLYSFVGLFNLANDAPVFYQINADPRTGGPADAQRYFRTSTYAGFAQDDWKFRPNLTFNLGVRWEYFTPLTEKRGRLTNLIFGSNGLSNSRVQVVDQLYKPDRNNFGPRLGFAWSPKHIIGENLQDKLVLRGGFAIAYNRIPVVLFANTRGNPPFFARYAICCGGDFDPFAGGKILYTTGTSNSPFSYPVNPALAQGFDAASGAPLGGAVEIYGAQPNEPNAYVYLYSFEGQYQLPANLMFSLGYQGSSSHKLIRIVNQNFLYANNSHFFAVYFPTPDVNANYNAMLAQLSRRFANGFQFDAIYRWAKSIDTLSFEGPGAVTNQTFPQDQRFERGPSDYDVRHHFILSGLWDVPFFTHRRDIVGKALGGWQLNGILTAHTGFPWTPLQDNCLSTPGGPNICPIRPIGYNGGALQDTSNDAFIRPGGNFPGGGAKYFVLGSGVPGIGRNSFRGPKYFDVDFAVAKRTGLPAFLHLGEGAFFEFKANFFNAFNILNLQPFAFSGFGTHVTDANFGRAERGLAGRVVELQGRFSF